VVISSDGKAVVTRDQIGGTRLWPALDGSVEPLVIPVQGPQQLSVETRPEGGFTVAVVDAAGGGKIFGVAPGGTVAELGSLALFRDHGIRLVDRAAAELASFEERRFRPTSLRPSADGKSFAAVVGVTGSGTKAEIQRLELASGEGGKGHAIRRLGGARTIEA